MSDPHTLSGDPQTSVASASGLWLASQSPRRIELLRQLGIEPTLLLPDPHEDAEALEQVHPGEGAMDYVQRVTRAKWWAAVDRLQRRGAQGRLGVVHTDADRWPILCADTTVTVDGRILGKPADATEARDMLRQLSGRSHQVLTSVAVGRTGPDSPSPHVALSQSDVVVAPLSEAVIAAYITSGEPFGKAGAYGIQGPFAGWVERIEGSYSGIMGLPLGETRVLLERLGMSLNWLR